MAVKQQYNIVGKYINEDDARDVVGYHLRSVDGSKQGRYSIEQIAFLIGKDQIVNCTAQLYKDKVLFRGNGISLDSLPVQKIKVNKPNRVGNRQQTLTGTQQKQVQQPLKPKVQQPDKPVQQPNKVTKASARRLTTQMTNVIAQRFGFVDISTDINPEDTWGCTKILGRIYNHDILVKIDVRVGHLKDSDSTVYNYEGITVKCSDLPDFKEIKDWYRTKNDDRLTETQVKNDINAICNKIASLKNMKAHELYSLERLYNFSSLRMESFSDLQDMGVGQKTEDEVIEIYTAATTRIINDNFESAYNNNGKRDIPRFKNDAQDIKINIDFVDGNLYYISINMWGFPSTTMVDKQRDKLIVSKSTMYLIQKESKEQLINTGFKSDRANYKRAHYHDVIIKARQFKYIPQFKWLKINYLKLNDTVFQGKLKTTLVMAAYNYQYDECKELVYNDASAFHWGVTDSISFNGEYNNVQGKMLGNALKRTLIHEMCHEYADYYFGGNEETDRNKWGDKLFGVKPWNKFVEEQLCLHGEKFGKAVEFAASNCEFTFEQIFGYGLAGSKVKASSEERDGNLKTTDVNIGRVNYGRLRTAEQTTQARQWYKDSLNNIITYMKKSLDLQSHNCISIVEQDFGDFSQGANINTDDINNRYMVPIAVYIQSVNSNFREKYKIMFEFNQRNNFVISLYRDFVEGNKGYLIKDYKLMFRDRNTGLGKILEGISKEIVVDLADA